MKNILSKIWYGITFPFKWLWGKVSDSDDPSVQQAVKECEQAKGFNESLDKCSSAVNAVITDKTEAIKKASQQFDKSVKTIVDTEKKIHRGFKRAEKGVNTTFWKSKKRFTAGAKKIYDDLNKK